MGFLTALAIAGFPAAFSTALLPGAPAATSETQILKVPTEWDWSMGSRLITGANGRTYLSWVEGQVGRSRLRYSLLGDEGFGSARTAAEGDNWMINWADYPTFAVNSDGGMAAVWLEQTGSEDTWSYGARVAVSSNGEDWSKAVSLHDDFTGPEYGFVSLVPLSSSASRSFGAIWLDSREMGTEEEDYGSGAMALMYRRISIGTQSVELGPELMLDDRTCDCCATAAVPGENGGLSVAFRDRSTEEVRDIAVLHLGGETPFERGDPMADEWMIPGCPVNGPSLVRRGSDVGLAWFTMDKGLLGKAKPKPVVKAAFGAADGGFGQPMRVDLGSPIGRASAAMGPLGQMYVAWLENGNESDTSSEKDEAPMARWMLRDMGSASQPSGARTEPMFLVGVPATRASGFGSLAWAERGDDSPPQLLFSFTNVGKDGKTRVETRLIAVP